MFKARAGSASVGALYCIDQSYGAPACKVKTGFTKNALVTFPTPRWCYTQKGACRVGGGGAGRGRGGGRGRERREGERGRRARREGGGGEGGGGRGGRVDRGGEEGVGRGMALAPYMDRACFI